MVADVSAGVMSSTLGATIDRKRFKGGMIPAVHSDDGTEIDSNTAMTKLPGPKSKRSRGEKPPGKRGMPPLTSTTTTRNGSPRRSRDNDLSRNQTRASSRRSFFARERDDGTALTIHSDETNCRPALPSSSMDSTAPRFYRSDHSFSLRAESSRSLGGHLDNFYSSRRSLYTNEFSSKNLGGSPIRKSRSESYSPSRKYVDDSDSAAKRNEIREIPIPVPVLDSAPRRPTKRSSIGPDESYTKYPEHLFNVENRPEGQQAQSAFQPSASMSSDTSPRLPQKRDSISGSNRDLGEAAELVAAEESAKAQQGTTENAVADAVENAVENAVEASEVEDDSFHDDDSVYYGGCDSSVTSELTSPTMTYDMHRPQLAPITVPPPPTKLSMLFQQSLKERRRENQKRFIGSVPEHSHGGLEGQSVNSSSSRGTRRDGGSLAQGSYKSEISSQSHLSLSPTVHSLLKMAADVVNCENLEQAMICYQNASQTAGLEIMNINVNLGSLQQSDAPSSVSSRSGCHEDLRLIGIIICMMRTKMALMFSEEGDYDRAIEFCRGALQVQRHQPALKGSAPKFLDENDMSSLMLLIIERLENAQMCLEDHKELLDKIDLHSRVSDFTETETIHSSIHSSTKEIVLEMLERSAHEDQNAVFEYDEFALEMLSVHAAGNDKHEEGIKYCRDALQIHLVALGLKHPRAGKSLLRVARMYRGKGGDRVNEELVLGYFQQTAAVLQRSNLSQRARVSVLNDIAVIHMRRLDFDEAIKFLLDALHAYDEEIDDESVCGGRHVATLRVWRNLGECYMHLEKFSIAEGALLKALAIQRDCRKMQDAAEKLEIRAIQIDPSLAKLTCDTSIADTICRIGKARAGGGDQKKALGIYRDALAVLNRTTPADNAHTELDLLEKRDQLSNTLLCIARAESDMKEYSKAIGMFQLSLKSRNTNGADVKDKRKSTRLHCLSCYAGIGDVYMKQKDFDKAMVQYKAAIEYATMNAISKSHPIIVATKQKMKEADKARNLAAKKSPIVIMLEKKADAEIERGALDMATETLKELLVIHRASLKRLKDNDLDTTEQVYAIACLLQTFGFVFAKNGDDENAERAFKDASRLFRKGGQKERTTL